MSEVAPLPVAVVGANGFLGGELVRLLSAHPRVRLAAVCAGKTAGRQLADVRPSLRGAGDLRLESFDEDSVAERARAVFLALPHGESLRVAAALRQRGVLVIDLGSDLRLRDPAAHRRWYGRDIDAPELLAEACYALPELTGAPTSDLIANPGCFATALALSLAPLAAAMAPGAPVTIFGVTGSSGSGIEPSAGVHHSLRVSSFTAYKTLKHQHLGELLQLLGDRGPVPDVRFVPHRLPAARGIHLTLTVDRAAVDGDVGELLAATYAGAALVDVVDGEVPMGAVQGSCRALIGVGGDDRTAVVFCAIDNLLKGGSGQAVQNLNLRMGWPETLGLPVVGVWP